MSERSAWLCFNDWAGVRRYPCIVVGETRTRFRVRVDESTRLAGRNRWIHPGETKLVPRGAVKMEVSDDD